jgi:hypothetical protein
MDTLLVLWITVIVILLIVFGLTLLGGLNHRDPAAIPEQ